MTYRIRGERLGWWHRKYVFWPCVALFLLALLFVAGCAGIGVIDETHIMVNEFPPCADPQPGKCHQVFPSREQLDAAKSLECTGYVMAKAYTLAAQGVSTDKMRVAVFAIERVYHAVLVVDGVALDNLSDYARPFDEYGKFNPVLIPVPWRI